MKKTAFILFCLISTSAFSQKFVTKNGHIKFFSEAPTENIEALNNQVNCAIDASNGNMVFKVLIKSFEFEKALMQEHFNENYLESDKFPNATFSGKIKNISDINFSKDGEYKSMVAGTMTIHGVSKEIEHEGTFVVNGDVVEGKSVFMVKVEDYDIKIPNTVVENIAEEIEVTVDVKLNKM